ncbi:MAG: polyprenol monophosphomannose synthase [Candidatus Vecturithrix sp.]|jgi:dolichol-phosphate mannosyltransferase|nr:polyprenol monophosphomannose synthase [Candidatus Vecturithrix sp.]
MADTSKTMVVIPTYNERENIEHLIRAILILHPEFFVTIVDDNSPDGTGELAEKLAESYPHVQVIHRPAKGGLGSAYIRGFDYALSVGSDYIIEMDADLSHDPASLADLVNAVEQYDLVVGSRYLNGVRVEGWPFRRLLLSKFANIYAAHILVIPVWDCTSGFRCYRREVLEQIDLTQIRSDGYAFQIEMLYYTYKHGFQIKEIPIMFRERTHGYSKISRHVVWEAFWLVLRCHAPLKAIIKHVRYLLRDYDEFVQQHPATQKRSLLTGRMQR